MRELYFPAFRAAVTRAHVASVMCSYNKVNGLYACQNRQLLQDVLRDNWRFDGFVVSDFGAAHDGVQDAEAGLDLEMPSGATYNQTFLQQVEAGVVPVAQIDTLLRHRYVTMIRFGLFDSTPAPHPIAEAAHGQVARHLAADSMVLLRNKQAALPLDSANIRSIAVLGPAADQLLEGGGAAFVLPLHTITPLDGLRRRFPHAKITFVGSSGAGLIDRRDTIDGLALTPALPGAEANGITAEYFDNTAFKGPPKVVRTERIPEVRTEFGAPLPGLSPQYSLRWTGTLRVPATGSYTIGFEMWGKMRLYLDNKLVLELTNGSNTLQSRSLALTLHKGHAYALRAEYVSTSRGLARLFWVLPDHVDPPSLAPAVAAARSSDTAIVFVGTWAHEGFDATTLALPPSQDRLIEAVAAANPHTVVVLQSGIPTLMPWVNKVAAIVEAWFPGEEGGLAIADVLSGDINPSAKLPLTFPADDHQVPASTPEQYPGVDGTETYTEGLEVGYRWQNAQHQTPLFPFGFGLSYTSFGFSGLTYKVQSDGTVDVSVKVRNQGTRDGADVVQLYLDYPSTAGEPPLQLRGFQKVQLRSGQAQLVHFQLDTRAFSVWSTQINNWQAISGDFGLAAGDSSRFLPLRRSLHRN
ncbi:MAG TPA: glycoside hydrolase family 3 C-terminal domain-containing protein [Acidobacteriaceae bacterium]